MILSLTRGAAVQIREKAKGEEKKLAECVLGVEKTRHMQSLLGYHGDETKQFVQVSSRECRSASPA